MLIGVTGTLGAGKGSVVKYLVEEKGFRYVSVTAFLAAQVTKRGLPVNRLAYHNMANEYRAMGPTKLQEAVYEEAVATGPMDRVVIEAQHTRAEVQFIQEKGGAVLAIDADLRTRYERIVERGGEKDKVTFEEFADHQLKEMRSDDANRNNLADSIEAADYRLDNNGSLIELHTQIDVILDEIESKK